MVGGTRKDMMIRGRQVNQRHRFGHIDGLMCEIERPVRGHFFVLCQRLRHRVLHLRHHFQTLSLPLNLARIQTLPSDALKNISNEIAIP